MDTSTVVDLGRQALWITVLISAPLLGIALLVGLIIGVLQAATSINEATLSFIPKLAALAITLAVVGVLATHHLGRLHPCSFPANTWFVHLSTAHHGCCSR